jgi:UDP:flavonoid glycosyltransferase YjiC (YdhE family)
VNVLLSPLSDPGYLYPAIAVGLELRRRGDAVHVLGRASAAKTVADAGLAPVSAADLGAEGAFSAGRWFADGEGQYRAARQAARAVGADVIVTSVLCHGALVAAESLDIPAVVIGFAAHLWTYRGGAAAGSRAKLEAGFLKRLQDIRLAAGLPERLGAGAGVGAGVGGQGRLLPLFGAAFLLRGDPELEEPGARLPDGVQHVGPCFWEPAAPESELDDVDARLRECGKPVHYVHLGRYFGGTGLWPTLVQAFTGGTHQAIVELGRTDGPAPAEAAASGAAAGASVAAGAGAGTSTGAGAAAGSDASASADILCVRKPWLGPLIDRADLVVTSATSAPVLGALMRGKPLAVAPEGSEQLLLARACVRAGVAGVLPEGEAAAAALEQLGADDALRTRARQIGARLAAVDGPARAADAVHRAVTGRARNERKESVDA